MIVSFIDIVAFNNISIVGIEWIVHNSANRIYAVYLCRYIDENVMIFIFFNGEMKAIPAFNHNTKMVIGIKNNTHLQIVSSLVIK